MKMIKFFKIECKHCGNREIIVKKEFDRTWGEPILFLCPECGAREKLFMGKSR